MIPGEMAHLSRGEQRTTRPGLQCAAFPGARELTR
jgi:hypothetical protein